MPTTDNVLNWFKSSEIDYFSAFIKLWLSFNAWYRQHYNEDYIRKDRDHINIIKGVYKNDTQNLNDYDRSSRNPIHRKFNNLMTHQDIESKEFRKYIEKFLYLFKTKNTKGFFDGYNEEEKSLGEFFISSNETARVIKTKLNKGIYFSFGEDQTVYAEGTLVIKNDLDKLYSYNMEIIYQARNALVHGDMAYNKDNHEIVKYCYLILYYLMEKLVIS